VKWVTRARPKVDRVACPWLIKKFIDPEAEIIFVPVDQIAKVEQEKGAISFDAPNARFGHTADKCTFEVLVEHYTLTDPALPELGRIVHGADVPRDISIAPEAAGLKAVAEGFNLMEPDDHRILELEFHVYDALYTWCAGRAKKKGEA
jgi:hypothetical protein